MLMFYGLHSIEYMDMSHNHITSFSHEMFLNTGTMHVLIFNQNNVKKISDSAFKDLNLKYFNTDNYRLCCVGKAKNLICEATFSALSSCEDLLVHSFVRVSVWLIGAASFVFNLLSISFYTRKKYKAVNDILRTRATFEKMR